jgi:hypothetical protein
MGEVGGSEKRTRFRARALVAQLGAGPMREELKTADGK